MKKIFLMISAALLGCVIYAQERIVPIPFGDMENWCVRYIKESALLGGKTQVLYNIGPTDTIRQNKAYDFSQTVWGVSNAYAAPAGIDKAACTTTPERRGEGTCACCKTDLVNVRVLGMIDIRVVISGTMFLGSVNEPVRSANDPWGSVVMGIPFSDMPKALMLDIKTNVDPTDKHLRAQAGRKIVELEGHDQPEIYCYLQKRWEEDGKIYAKRVGTIRQRFPESFDWKNNYRLPIHYGDITKEPFFKDYMDLFPCEFKARNSRGKMTVINEVGWADEDEKPTHVILMITAGSYDAWHGCPGNAIWVDNIKWVY